MKNKILGQLGKLIEIIEGIKIYIYGGDHNPPHFHAIKADDECMIEISSIEVMQGTLSNKDLKKVKAWAAQNKAMLFDEFSKYNPNLR